jgi:CBS-domain-containing membrane protein
MSRAKILEFGVTAVPVLDEEHKPVGVISLRDLSRPGEPHMSTPARVVRGSASIEEGARTLANADVHRLVVVDDAGVAIGMVSAVDFIRALTGTPAHHPSRFGAY